MTSLDAGWFKLSASGDVIYVLAKSSFKAFVLQCIDIKKYHFGVLQKKFSLFRDLTYLHDLDLSPFNFVFVHCTTWQSCKKVLQCLKINLKQMHQLARATPVQPAISLRKQKSSDDITRGHFEFM